MICAHFGLDQNPFSADKLDQLSHQREVFETLKVHCQQGGLCVVVGEPDTGKSALKEVLRLHDPKRLLTPIVNRTLHTYHSVLRILCQAFCIEADGRDFKCEKRLIDEAHKQNKREKMLAPIMDDAHSMSTDALRRLRLIFEDFPKNHNVILFGQPELLYTLTLGVNEDILSRVTYLAKLEKLAPDSIEAWVLRELDRVAGGFALSFL